MAHYAFIDDQNIVVDVIVGVDEGTDGKDWEEVYGDLRGLRCLRTSYNTLAGQHRSGGEPFRKNYAGVGYIYNQDLDAFLPPQPYPSWVIDEESGTWRPPTTPPDSELPWMWDEQNLQWTLPPAPPSDELTDPELKALSERIRQALA